MTNVCVETFLPIIEIDIIWSSSLFIVRYDTLTLNVSFFCSRFKCAGCHKAAGTKRKLKCADITSAYFQGQELDRLMPLRPPTDGFDGVPDGGGLIARMPVYGTRDAGRGLWKKICNRFKSHGLRENRIMPALFSITDGHNNIVCLLGTHVDGILRAADHQSQEIIDSVLGEFDIREVKTDQLRYCG